MIYYAVIDTNVIVSAMMNPDSIPGVVLKHALCGKIIPLINDKIVEEYNNVVCRNKFAFDETDINNVLKGIKERSIELDRIVTEDTLSTKKISFFTKLLCLEE